MMEMMDDVLGFVVSDKQLNILLDDDVLSQMASKLERVPTAAVGYREGL